MSVYGICSKLYQEWAVILNYILQEIYFSPDAILIG
jgi:hypothetical protein